VLVLRDLTPLGRPDRYELTPRRCVAVLVDQRVSRWLSNGRPRPGRAVGGAANTSAGRGPGEGVWQMDSSAGGVHLGDGWGKVVTGIDDNSRFGCRRRWSRGPGATGM